MEPLSVYLLRSKLRVENLSGTVMYQRKRPILTIMIGQGLEGWTDDLG